MDDPTKISITTRTSVIEASDLTDATVAPDPKTTPQIVSPGAEIEVQVVRQPVPPRDELRKELIEIIEKLAKVSLKL
jgi:hypothetical protein